MKEGYKINPLKLNLKKQMDESSLDTASDENKVLNCLREEFDSFIEEKYDSLINQNEANVV